VSTHSTEIQRNIPEEAGVWTLEPEGSVAILTPTSAPVIMSLIELPSWPSWMVLVVDLRREACTLCSQAGGWRRESK
jgi:hypothetical protein